jgi:hypothetical protein
MEKNKMKSLVLTLAGLCAFSFAAVAEETKPAPAQEEIVAVEETTEQKPAETK